MEPDQAQALVAAHFRETPTGCRRIVAGRNSRLFAVACASGRRYVVKCYCQPTAEGKCRRANEWRALTFLRGQGIDNVPEPLATFPEANASVLGFLDGVAPLAPETTDIDALVGFLKRLRRAGETPEARELDRAADACFTLDEVVAGLDGRVRRLAALPAGDAVTRDMQDWLGGEFAARRDQAVEAARRVLPDAPLPQAARALSPSDFGFHNALRAPEGRLLFVDFEYFGWDDPAKTMADVLLHPHPAMCLPPELAGRFRRGAGRLYADDPGLPARFDCLFPLYQLKWCTIMLNEFIAADLQRRRFAGDDRPDAAAIRRDQLRKAVALLRQDAA